MTSPTTETTLEYDRSKDAGAPIGVSLPRLYLLRLGYLVVAVGRS